MVERKYVYGIYYFIDTWKDEIAYIGLDSHIDRRQRIKAHYKACDYYGQPFNRALQNNPERFKPFVYCKCDSWEEMCQLEFDLINLYRPRFNYKHGGNGSFINKEFEYAVVKGGFNSTGKQMYTILDMDHKNLIRSVNFEFLQDICSKLNNNELTEEEVKSINRKNSSVNHSKSTNTTGFYRVYKEINERHKNGFRWKYTYRENQKYKQIYRVDLFDLEKEVKSRGLHWEVLDVDKATNTVKQFIGF